LPHAKADGLFGAPLQIVDRPVFGVETDGARADEAADLDGDAGPLDDVGDRLDVGNERTSRAVGSYFEAAVDDLVRETLDIPDNVRPCPRQSQIGGVDADAVEQMQNAQLLIDGRRANRRRLQAIAKRLVNQLDDGRFRRRRLEVPVEDQVIHDGTS
jgi:hypothetical protein